MIARKTLGRVREYPKDVSDNERLIEERAEYFTAALFLGSGKYERVKFTTRAEAVAYATKKGPSKSGKRWMIYAVAGDGRFAHLETI